MLRRQEIVRRGFRPARATLAPYDAHTPFGNGASSGLATCVETHLRRGDGGSPDQSRFGGPIPVFYPLCRLGTGDGDRLGEIRAVANEAGANPARGKREQSTTCLLG